MTKQQQIEQFDALVEKMRNIMLNKGDDYANEDRLSNFKLSGNICRLSPAKQCLSLIATKVARLGNLLDGDEPNNESTEDSVIDLNVYSMLLSMILSEQSLSKTTKSGNTSSTSRIGDPNTIWS